MNNSELREKAAQILLEHDLDITGSTVREVIDMMTNFGEFCARLGYQTAKTHELMKTGDSPLFQEVNEDRFIKELFK